MDWQHSQSLPLRDGPLVILSEIKAGRGSKALFLASSRREVCANSARISDSCEDEMSAVGGAGRSGYLSEWNGDLRAARFEPGQLFRFVYLMQL